MRQTPSSVPTSKAAGNTPTRWDKAVQAALAAFGFFLPFSSAGTSVFLAVLVALVLVRPAALREARPWRDPVMATGLLLLAYIAAHTVWFSGLQRLTASTVNQYHELLFAPILLALMRDERQRSAFFRGLVAGAIALAIAYWAAPLSAKLAGELESRRISGSLAFAVTAFLLLMRSRGTRMPWHGRVVALFLALTVLFAQDGRTGQLVLFVLAAVAAWAHAPARWRWAAALVAPVVLTAVALSSKSVQSRLQEIAGGTVVASRAEEMSSTAIRVELARLALDLSRRYALTGAGFANYPSVHEQAAQARYASDPARQHYAHAHWVRASNAHNEFATQLVGGGIIALVLFLAWLGLALRRAASCAPPVGTMLAGTTLAFAVGCLFNSMLLDFVAGHVYMGLLPWLLAQTGGAAGAARNRGEIQSVLVIATRQIGDVLLTTPLIEAARQRWPKARIEVLGFEGTLGMLAGNYSVDALISTPHRLGLSGWRSLTRKLWRRYDLALVTDAGDRAHLIALLASSRRSGIVPEHGGSNWWKRLLLDHVVVASGDRGSVHVTSEKVSLLDPWATALAQPPVVAPVAKPLPVAIRTQLRADAVVVHAPSMWSYKQWPIAHFESLVKSLLSEGHQVVLTGSASQRDQECIAPLRRLGCAPSLLDVSGQLDFNQLVALLQRAAVYVGPDTSVTHLAAASGVAVVAIFGPTNPVRWGPRASTTTKNAPYVFAAPEQHCGNVTLLQSSRACVPCGRAGCEDHRASRSDCLVDIAPERVLQQVLSVLNARQQKATACA